MVVGCAEASEDLADLIQTQDHGENALFGGADEVKEGDGPTECLLKEELDRTQHHCAGTPSRLFFHTEVKKILAELAVGELVWRGIEVTGERRDGSQIRPLRGGRQSAQAHVFQHPLT